MKDTTQDEAAFHESGHTYVAVRVIGYNVDWMKIYKEKDGWGGETRIPPDSSISPSWTTIAVAGIVAEAKADAERRFPGEDNRLIVDERVLAVVMEYAEHAEELLKRDIPAMQITFPTVGGKEGVSAMSINDVRRMCSKYRDAASVKSSLDRVTEICNDPPHWKLMSDLAKGVQDAPEHFLTRQELEKIIKKSPY